MNNPKLYTEDFGSHNSHLGNFETLRVEKKENIVPISNAGPHGHLFYEIEYYYSNEGLLFLNGQSYPLRRGLISFITPTDFHYVSSEKPYSLFHIAFPTSFVDAAYIQFLLKNPNKIIEVENQTKIEYILDLLESEYKNTTVFSNDALHGLISLIFSVCFSDKDIDENFDDSSAENINAILLYIAENYVSNLSVGEIAKHFGYSISYFCRFFKKSTGITCKEYINDIRLNMVRNLLKNTELSISEIADKLNFDSISSMSHHFKNKFNTTPSAFQKAIRKSKEN